ncbi:putative PIG3 family NAD(P)H quinone oxidoreductase [Friedmanniella endophytica]|uniref:Putative PIG3 family NAD(P)H quinone oxidoreductase n=1 Tax=Microlunatus kandeliicorticis TaxID=1759536 RepID=A0A7W3IRH6_9ACTN|nr:NAD(P)H-quinone oxidoreductase [Microlunatus kandeliicorticis]MBA8793865.1 putative PIG3 family NAD(P)H quinone oxidoreductase [Microlunatus kandeliicorticis]
MQAIQIREPGDPSVLELGEVDTPTPGHGEVLIKVAGAGINRADLQQRQGHYPPPPGASEILGMEVSGVIADVGAGVTTWENGQECVALLAGGGYAEYVTVPAGQVVAPPEGVDLVTAAGLIEVAATVTSNLKLARLREDEVFLVHGGAGGIGSFAIQYAKAKGATVVATAGSPDKIDYCYRVGADLAVSYRDDWAGAARDVGDGRGVDVILDNMGAKYLEAHVDLLAIEGRLVVIGLQGGRRGTLDLGALLPKRASVSATALRSRPVAEKTAIVRAVAEEVWPMIADGRIQPAPTTSFGLAEAAAAHTRLESGDNLGKLVLVP